MATLLLTFPARRYHATPFGHHVNEGVIEWPPSPWRLLRALLAVGYATQSWAASMNEPTRSMPPPVASALLLKLASVLPSYFLPPAVGAHSRHYMPVGKFDGTRERTTLVFDTWAQIETGELAINWPVELDDDEGRLLGELARALGYLGRSESWVNARLVDRSATFPLPANCFACSSAPAPGPGWEQVAVMAPEPAETYRDWQAVKLESLLADLPPMPLAPVSQGKPGPKDRKLSEAREAERRRAVAPYPADLIACLQADTNWLRAHGWSQPPGSRRVLYWRRDDALNSAADRGSAVAAASDALAVTGPLVTFALLALTSKSRNDHVLPLLARSLPQGEIFHRQMVGARRRIAPHQQPTVLSGRDESGQALRGAHRHAHVLSLDLDGDGHIDHLLVWAPDGLDRSDQQALRATRGTYTKGSDDALRLAFVAAGEAPDLQRLPAPHGNAISRVVGAGCEWISVTPFVPPRHVKPRGANTAEGQLRAELACRGFPDPRIAEWLDPQHDERARRLRHHVRVRKNGVTPPADLGIAWRLSFDAPVTGPICLGYGSHFGLGRFEAVSEARHDRDASRAFPFAP